MKIHVVGNAVTIPRFKLSQITVKKKHGVPFLPCTPTGDEKFLSQNNPVLIRSMRRFNIWVKKGFFNHFPNSKQLFPCSLVYMWFALICSFTLSLSVHVISCIQLLVDDVISLQRSLKLSIYFFPSDHMFPQLNSVLQTPGRYMLIPFLRKFWKLYYQHLTYP